MNKNTDTPDVIHGRMKEGAHIAGYGLQRAMENMRWLLEDSRYEQLAGGYKNVNDFLRDTQDAFALLNIKPEERKQIAELVKELQPKASQRAIGELLGVDHVTVGTDLGTIERDRTGETSPIIQDNQGGEQSLIGDVSPPALPQCGPNGPPVEYSTPAELSALVQVDHLSPLILQPVNNPLQFFHLLF